ncbi:MAG: hypothetical protein ACREA0_02585 [bacterium]
MAEFYTASARRNPGRRYWIVEFRHPLKTDTSGRPGRKTRKGLGTDDETIAQRLVAQLNKLLRDEGLWSLGGRSEAEKRFDPRVVDVFYSEIEPQAQNAKLLRDQHLPLPDRDSGYARVLFLGVPGAGKTTLLRHLIGSHPKRDRFPSASVNRTTTFPIEVITCDGDFTAVVTFLSEHEARFEIEECVSSAILKAVEGDRAKSAAVFLEPSDMRFRLKYLLGDLAAADEDDPYADPGDTNDGDVSDDASTVTAGEAADLAARLNSLLDRIFDIAHRHHGGIVEQLGPLSEMEQDDKSAALDLIQTAAEDSDDYTSLVSEVLDELRGKFDAVEIGRYEKSTTGWPSAWRYDCPSDQRADFLKAVRFFSGISIKSWGKLLTPLVNGVRVAGPFAASDQWRDQPARMIFIDTEGLSHKANTSADLPEHIISLFDEVDCILLVDSAKNAMTHFAAGKALEAVVSSGQTRKLVVAFTHMDTVAGENLRGKARKDHVLGGLRNVIQNQVAKAVSRGLAHYLQAHLEEDTFFLGKLDVADPVPAYDELRRLLIRFQNSVPLPFVPVAFPSYGTDKLGFAIQEAAQNFRKPWRAWLDIEPHADLRPYPWQSVKAMSRRYAEGWDDGYYLQPVSNLLGSLQRAISRFLETPLEWSGSSSEEQKREVIDRIKALVTREITALSRRRLRELPQPQWQSAYALRGSGSTRVRKMGVEEIYERWVPIPHSGSGKEAQEFLDDVKEVVLKAVATIEDEVGTAGLNIGTSITDK